jgi:hypothetical protein
MSKRSSLLTLLITLPSLVARPAGAWTTKQAPLMTRWAAQVNPDAPLPEYPRPQLVRDDWLNLNGVWEYEPGAVADAVPTGKKLASEILVPFPVESALSGVMEHHDRLWYRRSFTVPAAWKGRQVVLHFGAVDYESEAFVNGRSVGVHKGGYDPFGYEVTRFLSGDGPQELIVRVFDPPNDGGQPRGKQSLHPGGIMYTSTTGIWQTVWLEPVAGGGVRELSIVPDVDGGRVRVTTTADAGEQVTVTVKDGATPVGSAQGPANAEVAVAVPNAKLWSPDRPFLYDLQVAVTRDGTPVDRVASYFGMRKIALGDVNGVKRMLLNGKPVFEFGPLDQGFWPDGIYTAPTDEAIRFDIQSIKDAGFNMVRKHIKVEPARWYYWTDRLGLIVWQDMPSADSYPGRGAAVPPVDAEAFKLELTRMVHGLQNVPSILMWVTFNEGQGQHDAPELVALVKRLDPNRLVDEASGGRFTGAGDVHDVHSYPPPACPPPSATQALACGEFGGIGLRVPGHMWSDRGHSYTVTDSPDDLVDQYADFCELVRHFRDEQGLSAAVYTETTDVETEINGVLTYDRVPKVDLARLAPATRLELPPATFTPVVPTSEDQPQPWKFDTAKRPGLRWTQPAFDDAAWTQGTGGFGNAGAVGAGKVGTPWATDDIYLRRAFTTGSLTRDQVGRLRLRVCKGGDVEVYLNGVQAYRKRRASGAYGMCSLNDPALAAIRLDGPNVLAVHCTGCQYIDVGLSLRQRDAK